MSDRSGATTYRLSGRIEEAIAAFKAYDARHPGFGLADLVIVYQENGQADEAKQTAQRLFAARRNFTITSWLKTQFRRDAARLDADIRSPSRGWTSPGLSTLSLPQLAQNRNLVRIGGKADMPLTLQKDRVLTLGAIISAE